MKRDAIDLLIVGQGLAGSAVAMRALARGLRILVVDEPSANQASAVAAGMFNPVTGKRMARTWLAEHLFPVLFDYYTSVEKITGARFFFPLRMYRPFLSVEEQNEWMGASADPVFRHYVEKVFTSPAFDGAVNDPAGGLALRQTGFIDTRAYIDAVAKHLHARGAFERAWFHPDQLSVDGPVVNYRGLTARKVIFCQGVYNDENPWFRYVPIKRLKGEFISIQCGWPANVILNRGVYMVPSTAPGTWRVGATYNRHDVSARTTPEARDELQSKLHALIRVPFTVEDQQWGFRPTTPDRRPVIGRHPEHESLVIFNGLGTKGVSMAPYFSEVLMRWLQNEEPIMKEADITRYK